MNNASLLGNRGLRFFEGRERRMKIKGTERTEEATDRAAKIVDRMVKVVDRTTKVVDRVAKATDENQSNGKKSRNDG